MICIHIVWFSELKQIFVPLLQPIKLYLHKMCPQSSVPLHWIHEHHIDVLLNVGLCD